MSSLVQLLRLMTADSLPWPWITTSTSTVKRYALPSWPFLSQSMTLLGQYRHRPQAVETGGNLVFIAWNSTGDVLLLRVNIFLYHLNFTRQTWDSYVLSAYHWENWINWITKSMWITQEINNCFCRTARTGYEITVKSVKLLQKLGQFHWWDRGANE